MEFLFSGAWKNSNHNISSENNLNRKIYSNYVDSWRWFSINDDVLSLLYETNKIVKSTLNGQESVAILTDSRHFDRTLIVTFFSGSKDTALQIISFLQNYGFDKNYERIQILTKESLPSFNLLEYRISFYLMKKFLS